MTVSRRRFLEVVACAAPGALAGGRWLSNSSGAPAGGPCCVLIDAGADCVLPESLRGFRRGLDAAGVPSESLTVQRLSELIASGASPRGGVVFVPGGALQSASVAAALRALADRGATVVYESGAAYADSGDFAKERHLLQKHFGVPVDAPIDLWDSSLKSDSAPYVHYHWPRRVIVRDFSRMIPVSRAQHAFATIDRIPAAERVRLGAGEFIFLGSPLGPHLNIDDREALALMKAFVS